MKNKDIFYLHFQEEWFKKNDTVSCTSGIIVKILNKPRRKWYHLLLQFITFGLYEAHYGYKVKIIVK